ncbi:MAG: cytochrome b N-terminal domain-containing protein, partial [Fimbriimonadaceae bacterium]|nr:cytochrome b N-terminal domain-containing protein [Alphaproteobacteria bacterium]
MAFVKRLIARLFTFVESALDRVFSPSWNPFSNLGALGFFFFWIVTVSGLYLYIFFDTGVTEAYDSVEYLTRDQWYAGGIMRSLHRYASDGMVLVMVLHILREFSFDRYRGVRWFSWFTGVPILWFVIICGLTGYWLVWDKLAQYIAITTTEWLDWLPIFTEPIARNFITPSALEDRFFSLMAFVHIAAPLILLILLWVHLNRVTKANWNPPRGLSIGVFGSMLVLSLVYPAVSQGPADLATVPNPIGIDWFYLPFYPLLDMWPQPATWGMAGALSLILLAMPWLPPLRRRPAAVVNLENCNGCTRCAADCPFVAIQMVPRTDGQVFAQEAKVNEDLCTSCGICAGSCPTSTPFRRRSELVPGIDLPDYSMRELRKKIKAASSGLEGDKRIMIIGCDHSVKDTISNDRIAT